jgi:hypothetical protein
MKPGDLVTIRRMNLSHRVPITYIDVHERIDVDEDDGSIWKWEHGEVGVLLEGWNELQMMAQVLHRGRIGWVDAEHLKGVACPAP